MKIRTNLRSNESKVEKANSDTNKRPEADLRSFVELGASNWIRYSSFGSGLLDGLVSVARQTDVHLPELR